MIKVVPIGGTERAYNTMLALFERTDIEVPFVIIMPGDEREKVFADKLSKLCTEYQTEFFITQRITEEICEKIEGYGLDLILGVGVWRSLVSERFFDAPRYGYLAMHGSRLPNYRGWAGINWQIINGCEKLEMAVFRLASGVDNGPLVANKNGEVLEYSIDLQNEYHLEDVFREYEKIHIKACNAILDLVASDEITFIEQDESMATYSCQRGPEDGEINWDQTSEQIFNFIRAQSRPYLGAFTFFDGEKIHIHRARVIDDLSSFSGRIPGKVVERNRSNGRVRVLTKDSGIEIIEVALSNSKTVAPYDVFFSVRKKCKTKVEALADKLMLSHSS